MSESAESTINVSEYERIASLAGGVAIVLAGLIRRRAFAPAYLALGGYLIRRGVTGQCAVYDRLGLDTAEPDPRPPVPDGTGLHLQESITVSRPPEEMYAFWRNLANLPRFMPHLQSVTESADGLSRWVVSGPGGIRIAWEAEIFEDKPGELIAWRSRPGSTVDNAGTVRFAPAPEGGTTITVQIQYRPPGGRLGAIAAAVFGVDPEAQLHGDLARFQQLLLAS